MMMLDTNTVSYFWRNDAAVVVQMRGHIGQVCISSVTAAELHYGVAKRQNAKLAEFLEVFLANTPVLAWDEYAAARYGTLRAEMERSGKVMSLGDQMIAAHALSQNLPLISSDKAFLLVPGLVVRAWR